MVASAVMLKPFPLNILLSFFFVSSACLGERLHTADQNLLDDCLTASLWLAAQDEKFYQEWEALPAGSHLKEVYSEQVWNWSDRDMAVITETDPMPEGLRFPKPE